MNGEPVVGDKSPLENAADLLLYAPVGLAVAARELLPALAERGRAEISSQVTLARMVGQLVVRQGQDEVGRAVGGAKSQVGSLFDQLVRTFGGGDDDTPAAQPEPAPAPAPPVVVLVPEPIEEPAAVVAPAASSLAIPDYDSLAASQVIPRLASLAPAELEQIRAYETATRGRRTVLGRIAQLQG